LQYYWLALLLPILFIVYEYKTYQINPPGKHFVATPRTNLFFKFNYELVGDEVGAGASGFLYKVKKRGDDSGIVYAAKLYRRGFQEEAEREFKIKQQLDHPGIPKLMDYYHGGWFSSSILVMELVSG
jgi:hypothetical protein